jgi:hypothetical protein
METHTMKFLTQTLLLSVLVLTFSACSKKNEAPSTSSIIQQGKWRVVSFTDNGVNETATFSNYDFTFGKGSVTAVKATSTITGTWNTGADESQNRLMLNFNSPTFADLNVNWTFTEKSYSLLKLEYVTSASTDVLVLQRVDL